MARIKTDFPRQIRVLDHCLIPMADGTQLSARIWLPEDAEQNPVPALLEYIPYRKNDWTAPRDAMRHPYLAGHGYASVRVDLRGSGDSEGILYDEYLQQEQDDALEVIAWLAAQPWCTGAVGMFGKSWGGFNALQVAARRPPALKAIITLYSTDDRYADDIHYIGGCLFGTEHLSWATTMLAFNARPPDPRHVGASWRKMWLERLERTPPYLAEWLKHQRRDAFWRHGSVCEDWSAIACAVYVVGAWADGYTNAVPRLLQGLTCPRKGLIGPWSHQYPETAVPGPAIGFLQESLRWWDYWLKGRDTGIMDEPMLRVWMQDSAPPSILHTERPGRWIAEPSWPPPDIEQRTLYLEPGRLRETPAPDAALEFRGAQACGMDAGVYYSMSIPGDEPPDQRREDGMSLVFDSAPLREPMEILGFPELSLTLSSDRPQALLVARLCDVAPTGESTLVSRGILNLTHRESDAAPTPLEPGRLYDITLRLRVTGHSIKPGHRWRLALSPTYFPWAWPSPEPVTLKVLTGARARLVLPLRQPRPEDAALAPFEPAEISRPLDRQIYRPAARSRTVLYDVTGRRSTLSDHIDAGHFRIVENGIEYDEVRHEEYSIGEDEPLSARAQCSYTIKFSLDTAPPGEPAARGEIRAFGELTADRECFYVTQQLGVTAEGASVFAREWKISFPRDQM